MVDEQIPHQRQAKYVVLTSMHSIHSIVKVNEEGDARDSLFQCSVRVEFSFY